MATRACIGLAAAAVIGWGARHGVYGLLVAAALLVAPVLWIVARPGWRTAWQIAVADEYVEATGYGGTRTRLAWESVGEVQHFVRRTTRGSIRVLRLLSIDRQRDVIFDDRLPGFAHLMGLVEMRVRQVSSGTPSSWGQLLWSRNPGTNAGRWPALLP